MTNIDELINQSKATHQPTANDVAHHGPEISQAGTQAELEAKMGEIKRRDTEIETLGKARAEGLGYLSLEGVTIESDVLRMIPEPSATRNKVISFYFVPYQQMRLGSPIPESPAVKKMAEDLSKQHHTPVKVYRISEPSFQDGLAQYAKLPKITHFTQKVEITPDDLKSFEGGITSFDTLTQKLRTINTSELIVLIVAAGVQFNASDIHIESEQQELIIRYRIDGVLHEAARVGAELYKPISSRVKLLSDLKINVTNRPQDGHFTITTENGNIDVRVSTLPTNYGESIVMRILRSDIAMLKLTSLGLNQYNYDFIKKEITQPNGMLVVCGPTGSGKTTTLYAILGEIKTSENKIVTIEDPIEYQIPGISQSQVNREKKYTFAAGLRSLVRQDPDVILVGEMRDHETVEISINAALTGHYVLTTMHTNDAAGAIPRYLSMDAKPYLLAPALNTVIAQRLIRLLCKECKQETPLPEEYTEQVNALIDKIPENVRSTLPPTRTFYSSPGCPACQGLGYKGRTGIFEIFSVTPEIEKSILSGELSSIEIKKLLAAQGMITMTQDGIIRALKGETTVAEVFRVIQEK